MGEAKRRKQENPNTYGKIPKHGRGLVLSAPATVNRSEQQLMLTGGLNPQELRLGLLFWDKLAWPNSNAIHIRSDDPDVLFLMSEGILTRPLIRTTSVQASEIIVEIQTEAFKQLELEEPGSWAMSQGENSLLIVDNNTTEYRSALVELVKAIPIPDKNVPLAEILELKHSRNDEFLALRCQLDCFYSNVANASDRAFELKRSIAELDKACADVLNATKNWRFPMHLSDIKASFEIGGLQSALSSSLFAFMGGLLTEPIGMEKVGAVLGMALGCVKITGDISLSGLKARQSSNPYRYVHRVHHELTWSQ